MNGPHLDDEALSAALDDSSGTPHDQTHLAGCPVCQARLGQLASIAEAIGSPVPARPPDEVTTAIERALASAPVARPAAIDARAATPEGAATGPAAPAAIHPHRSPRRWLGVVGAAAAAAVLVAGVGIAQTRGGRGSSHSVAATSSTASSGSGVGGPAAGSDLGEQTDPGKLAALLTARLDGESQAASSGEAALPARPPGVAAPPPGPLPSSQTGAPSIGVESTCLQPAMRAAGQTGDHLGALRLVAPVRWRDQPALVFVFDRQPPASGRAGVVIATSGCTLLRRLPM